MPTILLVEDEPTLSETLRYNLEREGYTVLAAGDGDERDPRLASAEVVLEAASEELEQALQQQPDAVFLVGLINRTHAQKRKLARLGLNAG